MEQEFSFKELYEVVIKTTQNMELNGKTIEAGETVISFDKIQISSFNEIRKIKTANGGFDNRPFVWWETVNDVSITLNQGVFSKEHLAMMVNAKLYKSQSGQKIMVNKRETPEVSLENTKVFTLKYEPREPFFVYDLQGNKIDKNNISVSGKQVTINQECNGIIADYYFEYNSNYQYIIIGEELQQGYFTLEGKTRVKDDITGQVHTGLIKIPKLKLVSDLSMRLGRNAEPVMGSLDAVACPVGPKGHTKVMEMYFLSEDVDSDL